MIIYTQSPKTSYAKTAFSSKPYLEGFYVACAKVSDEKLIYYSTSSKDWAQTYADLFLFDPIVSLKPEVKETLSLTAWRLSLPTKDHLSFCQKRQSVTNVDFGLTASRSVRKNDRVIHEFYALGTKTGDHDKKDKILQNKFVYLAIKDIFNEFSLKI